MKGIVYTGEGAEVLDGLEVRDPGPGEVIVRIVAAGVCHSDITLLPARLVGLLRQCSDMKVRASLSVLARA